MKKNTLVGIAAWIAAIAFLPNARGQGTNFQFHSQTQTEMNSIQKMTLLAIPTELSAIGGLDVNSVNVRAIKDFNRRFVGAVNEKWFSVQGGFLCYFQLSGFDDRAFYDKKGQWLSSLKLYGENQLPKDIRFLVRGNYFDYSIVLVEEIQIPRNLVYIIRLEDKSNVKVLGVTSDGEMETLQDYVRDEP